MAIESGKFHREGHTPQEVTTIQGESLSLDTPGTGILGLQKGTLSQTVQEDTETDKSRRTIVVTQRDVEELEDLKKRGNFSPRVVVRAMTKEESADAIARVTEGERKLYEGGKKIYKWYDSPLDYPDKSRGDIDEVAADFENGIYPYALDFDGFVPRGQTFTEYVNGKLPHDAIGIDVGGPGSAVFSVLDTKESYGMTLNDFRSDEQKEADKAHGHDIIPGDFQTTWEDLDDRLGDRKAHVIFGRIIGAEQFLPQDPYFMYEQADNVYQRLSSEHGTLFVPVPKVIVPIAVPWILKTADEHGDTVVTRLANGPQGFSLQIEKRPGAPEHLPALSAREVRKGYTTFFEEQIPIDIV
jgi:hypothetical protein